MSRETIHWLLDGFEVPVAKGWSAAMVASGGYENASLSVPVANLHGVDQGAPVEAIRSGGKTLYFGRVVQRPKRKGGIASLTVQGPAVAMLKAQVPILFQDRDYAHYAAADAEPYNLQANSQGISLSNDKGYLEFSIDAGQTIDISAIGRFAIWPMDRITRIAFRQSVIAKDTDVHNDYNIRLSTYRGPNNLLTTGAADWAVGDGNGEDFELDEDCDMITLGLRRVSADTSSSKQIIVRLHQLRINGRELGDNMFGSEGIRHIAAYMGWYDGNIDGSGINVLPLFWPADSSDGLNGLANQLSSFDAWRWLAVEPPRFSSFPASLEFGAYGAHRRTWHVKQEQGADDDFDHTEIFNGVQVPYDDMQGAPKSVTLMADPDPLAFTGRYHNGTPEINIFPAEKLQDRQPDEKLAANVANNLLPQVQDHQLIGSVDVYAANDDIGPVSKYELKAGDLLVIDDYDPPMAPQRIVRVDWDETKAKATLTADISAASILAQGAVSRARKF